MFQPLISFQMFTQRGSFQLIHFLRADHSFVIFKILTKQTERYQSTFNVILVQTSGQESFIQKIYQSTQTYHHTSSIKLKRLITSFMMVEINTALSTVISFSNKLTVKIGSILSAFMLIVAAKLLQLHLLGLRFNR